MSDLYNRTAEKLLERLTEKAAEWNRECVDLKKPFPSDQFSDGNPTFDALVKEVEGEFQYDMSEFQSSWAVVAFLKGGKPMGSAQAAMECVIG